MSNLAKKIAAEVVKRKVNELNKKSEKNIVVEPNTIQSNPDIPDDIKELHKFVLDAATTIMEQED